MGQTQMSARLRASIALVVALAACGGDRRGEGRIPAGADGPAGLLRRLDAAVRDQDRVAFLSAALDASGAVAADPTLWTALEERLRGELAAGQRWPHQICPTAEVLLEMGPTALKSLLRGHMAEFERPFSCVARWGFGPLESGPGTVWSRLGQEAIPVLLDISRDPSESAEVRAAAILVCGAIDVPLSVEVASEFLHRLASPEAGGLTMGAYLGALHWGSLRNYYALITVGLKADGPKIRDIALFCLHAFLEWQQGLWTCVERMALEDPDGGVRTAAALLLRHRGWPLDRVRGALEAAVTDPDPAVRRRATNAARFWPREPADNEWMWALLKPVAEKDDDETVRHRARGALFGRGPVERDGGDTDGASNPSDLGNQGPELREGDLDKIPIPAGKTRYRPSAAKIQTYPWPESVTPEERSKIEEAIHGMVEIGGRAGRDGEKYLVQLDGYPRPGKEFKAVGRLISEFKNLMDKHGASGEAAMSRLMVIDRCLRKIDGFQERDYKDFERLNMNSTEKEADAVIKCWNWWYDLERYEIRRTPWDPKADPADLPDSGDEAGPDLAPR